MKFESFSEENPEHQSPWREVSEWQQWPSLGFDEDEAFLWSLEEGMPDGEPMVLGAKRDA